MIAALWMLLGVASAIECPDVVRAEDVVATLERAETSWREMDDGGFHDRAAELVAVQLPCVVQPLPTDVAVRTHVVMALHLWLIGDEERARVSWRAARTADPEAVIDEAIVAPDHPLRETPPDEKPKTKKVPEPREGSVSFDGRHVRLRPADLPTLVQVIDRTGRASATAYLDPRDPLPRYPAIPRRRNTLLGCAIAGIGLAGGAYATSWGLRADLHRKAGEFEDGEGVYTEEQLLRRRSVTNTVAIVPIPLLATAGGCAIGAAVIGER